MEDEICARVEKERAHFLARIERESVLVNPSYKKSAKLRGIFTCLFVVLVDL
jgi:hypothetical protein